MDSLIFFLDLEMSIYFTLYLLEALVNLINFNAQILLVFHFLKFIGISINSNYFMKKLRRVAFSFIHIFQE